MFPVNSGEVARVLTSFATLNKFVDLGKNHREPLALHGFYIIFPDRHTMVPMKSFCQQNVELWLDQASGSINLQEMKG
jgi:hypothetical protein